MGGISSLFGGVSSVVCLLGLEEYRYPSCKSTAMPFFKIPLFDPQ
ncbi:unnamed protein product [Urochloa decumbens]|uniref:Uncharacterized protein n=1 Tax=Urochloa decumbens TaxID=240449 RepID=A0ABC9GLC0_9POAL